jgi:hypothetical protein
MLVGWSGARACREQRLSAFRQEVIDVSDGSIALDGRATRGWSIVADGGEMRMFSEASNLYIRVKWAPNLAVFAAAFCSFRTHARQGSNWDPRRLAALKLELCHGARDART